MSLHRRKSKYDPLYQLPLDGTFHVPERAEESVIPHDATPAQRAAMRAYEAEHIVPTTAANLRNTLVKAAQRTGRHFIIEPKRVYLPYHGEDVPHMVVRRVAEAPPRTGRTIGVRTSASQRVHQWLQAKDTALAAAWDNVEMRQFNPDIDRRLKEAVSIAKSLAADAVHKLKANAASFKPPTTTLPRADLRGVHPDIPRAAKIVERTASKMLKDEGHAMIVQVTSHNKNMAGNLTQVWQLVDATRLAEYEERSIREAERALDTVVAGKPPADRRGPHTDFNYFWWEDIARVNVRLHPIPPGGRAKVCFMRQTPGMNTEPRKDEIERWLDICNRKWSQWVDANPDCGVVAPHYQLVGRFNESKYLVYGVINLAHDAVSGAVVDTPIDWDINDTFAVPVESSKFTLVRCVTRTRDGTARPVESRTDIEAQLVRLKPHGVRIGLISQPSYGAGVYLLDRSPDGVDLQALRAANPMDTHTAGVTLSSITGE